MNHILPSAIDGLTISSRRLLSARPCSSARRSTTEPHFVPCLTPWQHQRAQAASDNQLRTQSTGWPSIIGPHFSAFTYRLWSHISLHDSRNGPHSFEYPTTFCTVALEYRATFPRLLSHNNLRKSFTSLTKPLPNYLNNCLFKRTKQPLCCFGGLF